MLVGVTTTFASQLVMMDAPMDLAAVAGAWSAFFAMFITRDRLDLAFGQFGGLKTVDARKSTAFRAVLMPCVRHVRQPLWWWAEPPCLWAW